MSWNHNQMGLTLICTWYTKLSFMKENNITLNSFIHTSTIELSRNTTNQHVCSWSVLETTQFIMMQMYIYETKEAHSIFQIPTLQNLLCTFMGCASTSLPLCESTEIDLNMSILHSMFLEKPEELLELIWSWCLFRSQTFLNFFVLFLYAVEMSPSPMTFMTTKRKHPTIRRGVQQIEFPSRFHLWSDPILLLEKATESIVGRNVRFHFRSKFRYWYRKRALNRSQVWGRDIVPGRSHVNSSGWSFCTLWSCIFTAHNPTKNCFLRRRITNFTSCRLYANIEARPLLHWPT